jgi:hypothetical protein
MRGRGLQQTTTTKAAKTHTNLFVSKARKDVDNGCYSSLDHTSLGVVHSNFSQQLLHLESRKRRIRHRFSNCRLISHKTLMTTTSLHCRQRTKCKRRGNGAVDLNDKESSVEEPGEPNERLAAEEEGL